MDAAHVVRVCSKCFICFRRMLQVFYLDVAMVMLQIYVSSVLKRILQLFYLSVVKVDLDGGLLSEIARERASAGAMAVSLREGGAGRATPV